MWRLIVAAVLVWAWQFLNWVWVKPKRLERFFRKQGMKGSPYTFLLGDMRGVDDLYKRAYSKPIAINDDIVPRLMPNILHTIREYGDFSFNWMGPRPRVYVINPYVLKELLTNYRKYKKPFTANNPIAKMLISKGLANMEGDEWYNTRSKINPSFYMTKLKPLLPSVQACCQKTQSEWKQIIGVGGGGPQIIDIKEHVEMYTSSVLAQLMFSSPYSAKVKETFFKLLELESLGRLSVDLLDLPGQQYFPTKRNMEAKKIDQFVRDSFTSMINERLEKMRAGEIDTNAKHKDLLDIFMEELYNDEKNKSGGNRHKMMEEIIGQCKIFFFAGFDTSANTICWAMILLSVHKEWQERAREEAIKVLGDKEEIFADDLSQLKVITMIMNEVLRLYPSSMELSRLIVEDTKVGDYIMPKGTLMTCPILLVNRSSEVWGDDALNFDPSRFSDGVAKATSKYGLAQFMPFGCGPRICIGQNMAVIEFKVFMLSLLRKFSFELSPTYKHGPVVNFTIHPQYGAPLILTQL